MIGMQILFYLLIGYIASSGSSPGPAADDRNSMHGRVDEVGSTTTLNDFNVPDSDVADRKDPTLIFHDPALMQRTKQLVESGDAALRSAANALHERAVIALDEGPFSVTHKSKLPPSGDIHDYYSMGPYWWPDPEKEDGLPYVRRDGERNPEVYEFDRQPLRDMLANTYDLALAWYFFEDERFASKALEMLQVWFLDPETRMNPNLVYGQHIPGRVEGRGIGIIDTKAFYLIPDILVLIETSDHFREETREKLRAWMTTYLDWLWNHPYGQEERVHPNNHSTAYDVQTASLALFTGDTTLARSIIGAVPERRINPQIRPDGRQPEELERTKAFSYSAGNLNNFFQIGTLGEHLGIDIFGYTGPGGQSVKNALDYLIPYAMGEKKWPYQQISEMEGVYDRMFALLKKAAYYYDDLSYARLAEQLAKQHSNLKAEEVNLLYP